MNEHRMCVFVCVRARGFGVRKDDLGGNKNKVRVRGETHVSPENVLKRKSGNLKMRGTGECSCNRSPSYAKTSATRRFHDDDGV